MWLLLIFCPLNLQSSGDQQECYSNFLKPLEIETDHTWMQLAKQEKFSGYGGDI